MCCCRRIASADLTSEVETPGEDVEDYPVKAKKRSRGEPLGPVPYLVVVLMLACFWLLLIFIEDTSGHGLGVWIARLGYGALGFLWFGLTIMRFKDAGFGTGS